MPSALRRRSPLFFWSQLLYKGASLGSFFRFELIAEQEKRLRFWMRLSMGVKGFKESA